MTASSTPEEHEAPEEHETPEHLWEDAEEREDMFPEGSDETSRDREAADDLEAAVENLLAEGTHYKLLFSARWGVPSVACAEHAEQLPDTMNIDVDRHPRLADRFEVWVVPTVVTLSKGSVRRRTSGAACLKDLSA